MLDLQPELSGAHFLRGLGLAKIAGTERGKAAQI